MLTVGFFIGEFFNPCPLRRYPPRGGLDIRRPPDLYCNSREGPVQFERLRRAASIQPRTWRTRRVTSAKSPRARRSFERSFEPMPRHAAPARIQAPTLSSVRSTPPVAMMEVQGQGPRTDSMKAGPPTPSAGKTFTISQPSSSAAETSVRVAPPGGEIGRAHV